MKTNLEVFKKQLADYKQAIDADIDAYAKQTLESVAKNYSKESTSTVEAYLKILQSGGKRIRGALVMVGYEMAQGKDSKMILQAARAIEMLHASMLVLDDIADRSDTRRGNDSAHIRISKHHQNNKLKGDSAHFGEAIATVGALIGNFAAEMILANLPVDPELAIKAISITNRSLLVTSHGQANDIFNEAKPSVSEDEVNKVIEWKTAVYSLLNPLHVGMVLAGAGCEMTDAITPFAINAGKAFQVTDDIVSTFSQQTVSGKNPMDDLREGKQTLLVVYALKHASKPDRDFLNRILGNIHLTKTDFEKAKQILIKTGALAYAQNQAQKYIQTAISSLEKNKDQFTSGYQFLSGLAEYLATRKS